ncbi:hypothetical protein TWF281_004529 [Arthrobotrys megalospora]
MSRMGVQSKLPAEFSNMPLEIQYQILDLIIADWLEQPLLRQVCRAWRDYIDTSRTAFLARYDDHLVLGGTAKLDDPPRFHRIIGYRSTLVQSKKSPRKLIPCVIRKDESGDIVGVSREANLSMFLSDPLVKPTDLSDRICTPKVITIEGAELHFSQAGPGGSAETGWNIGNGTVGSFLRHFSEEVDGIFGVTGRGVRELSGEWKYFKIRFTLDTAWYRMLRYGLGSRIQPLSLDIDPDSGFQ